MSKTNTNCITHPNLLTGIAVVGGVDMGLDIKSSSLSLSLSLLSMGLRD